MELYIDRAYKGLDFVISNLFVNGREFCYVLEDADRGLNSSMDETTIRRDKIYGKTAIPTGLYRIVLDVKSPRFGDQPFYQKVCGGYLPRLENVKGYDGVLVHVGNTIKDTNGCLLVGLYKDQEKGMVTHSKDAFSKLYPLLKDADARGEEIWIQVGKLK